MMHPFILSAFLATSGIALDSLLGEGFDAYLIPLIYYDTSTLADPMANRRIPAAT